MKNGIKLAIKEKFATLGDTIILTCSAAIGEVNTDLMKIHTISEEDLKDITSISKVTDAFTESEYKIEIYRT